MNIDLIASMSEVAQPPKTPAHAAESGEAFAQFFYDATQIAKHAEAKLTKTEAAHSEAVTSDAPATDTGDDSGLSEVNPKDHANDAATILQIADPQHHDESSNNPITGVAEKGSGNAVDAVWQSNRAFMADMAEAPVWQTNPQTPSAATVRAQTDHVINQGPANPLGEQAAGKAVDSRGAPTTVRSNQAKANSPVSPPPSLPGETTDPAEITSAKAALPSLDSEKASMLTSASGEYSKALEMDRNTPGGALIEKVCQQNL